MAQLISNVLMQPKPTDAVERPMTLIEKLEQERTRLNKQANDDIDVVSKENHAYQVGLIGGLTNAIKIVKQHQAESGWIACSERMPEDEQEVLWWNEAYQCLVIGEWRENRELVFYRNGDYADVSEFFYWQCLPKPPSEVQDD